MSVPCFVLSSVKRKRERKKKSDLALHGFFLGSNLQFFTRDLDFPCIAIDLYNFIICWSLLAKGVYPKPKLEKKNNKL